ncbi:MAG: IclR family transcriptional regulator [Chloroflexota bacterium]
MNNIAPQNVSLSMAPVKKDLINSVQRALNIMSLLAQTPQGLTPKQIALNLSLNVSTCYHLLNTLVHEGYVIKDPDTRLFRLSGKIAYTAFELSSSAQLVKQLTSHVQSLQEITQETTYLAIWDGQDIVLSGIAEAPQAVRVRSLTLGFKDANHASALGKSILAHLNDEQVDRYFERYELHPYTSNTITSVSVLKQYLRSVHQMGYTVDDEEFLPEVHCFGAPIFDAYDQIIASIAISMPANRARKNRDGFIDNVKKAAEAASHTLSILGYVGPQSHINR